MEYRIATGWMRPFDAVNTADPDPAHPQAEVLRLFNEHGTSLYRFCYGSSLGGVGDAEDVVQDTFLKLLRHLQAGGNRPNLKSWLFTVAANDCRSRIRWRVRWLPWQAEHDKRAVEPPDEPHDWRALARRCVAWRTRSTPDLAAGAGPLIWRDCRCSRRAASVGRAAAGACDRPLEACGGAGEPRFVVSGFSPLM